MVVFERMSQSFQLEGQAEQRKRITAERHAPSYHQQNVKIVIMLRKMPEECYRK